MSATQFLFRASENALTKLGDLDRGNIVSYFGSLPWSFLQYAIYESADFNLLSFLKRVISALTSEYDAFFDEETDNTTRDDALKNLRSI